MARPVFETDGEAVVWNAGARPFRLHEREVEMMLDILQREEAAPLFNQLYTAHLAVGGVPLASRLIAKAA